MESWRPDTGEKARFSGNSRISLIACLIAALFMLAGATYAFAHDHDDHAADFDGECVVCSLAALGAVKLSPEVPSPVAPEISLVGIRLPDRALIADSFHANTYPVRGPPLSVSFC
ncbi:MAG: DUF2946 family protein [Pseudomonadota bacterium]